MNNDYIAAVRGPCGERTWQHRFVTVPAKYVYLAGPITGKSKSEAGDWRKDITEVFDLNPHIIAVNPLRCEPDPHSDETYALSYTDLCFGTPKAIAGKNYYDVANCDIVLAYLPDTTSVGTLIEVGWAKGLRKPCIIVTEDKVIRGHPLMQECSNWIVPSFKYAFRIIEGLVSGY